MLCLDFFCFGAGAFPPRRRAQEECAADFTITGENLFYMIILKDMNDGYYRRINLAGLSVETCTDNSFVNIRDFLDKFADDNPDQGENQELKILFAKGNRKIELSSGWNSLSIIGDDIDDLHNPFNLIGIAQALFRFAAIQLAPKGIFLLHGSTTVLDDKAICFGDDGSSTAKTLSSLEVALVSKHYVADEFCFFNSQTKEVSGYRFIPIHIRPVVKEHLEKCHGFSSPKSYCRKTLAGEFVEQDKLFTTISGKLKMLAYTHFSEKDPEIQKLSIQEATKAFGFCITSHVAKLLHPNFDRMRFSSMTDTDDVKIINEELVSEILAKITNGNKMPPGIFEEIPSYRLIVSQPCQIIDLLRKGTD